MKHDMNYADKSGRNSPILLEDINREELERFLPFSMLLLGSVTLGFAINSSLHGETINSLYFYTFGISSLALYVLLAIFDALKTVCWAFTLILAGLFYFLLLKNHISYAGLFGCLAITPGFVAARGWRQGGVVLILILCSLIVLFYSGVVDTNTLNYSSDILGRFLISFIGLSSFTLVVDYSRHKSYQRLVEVMDQYRHVVRNDPLTGVSNRQELKRILRREYYRFLGTKQGFFLALVDIDGIRQFNRRYGSRFGDRVLQLVGNLLQENLRGDDFVARWGDDEFMILLKGDDPSCAIKVIARIKERLGGLRLEAGSDSVSVTLSVGLIHISQSDDIDEILGTVERNLSSAKQQGKDQLVCS